ncbi:MAG TPA: sugar ABC transporter permease [Bacillota bacterium]|nr:sugar ABC transporter permease [Bacillota bacterium]
MAALTVEAPAPRGRALALPRVLAIYLVLLVPMGLVVWFVAWPIVATVLHSFDHIGVRGTVGAFAGLANYRFLFAQPLFAVVLRNTAIYAGLSVVLCVVLAFLLALLLTGRGAVSRLLLVAIFSPTVMPMIAAANIWLYFLAPRFGLVGKILAVFGIHTGNLLGQPGSALGVLVVLFVWKYAPYFTLFLMAGLQAIPQSVREALRTEDPGGWHAFRSVILPMLTPMIAFVTTMALLYAAETVDPVYVMTQGGPNNATNLLMFYLYQLGFNYFAWGGAAALSALLMGGLSSLSALALIGLERRAFHWQ